MIYETEQDRVNQRDTCDAFNIWMNGLPGIGNNGEGFTFKELPTVEGEQEVDFSMWWNHLCVGMIEIKCLTKDHPMFLMGRPKLKMLWKYKQNGVPGILIYRTPEGIWAQDIRLLVNQKDKWKDAPPECFSETDHGNQLRSGKVKGFLLPKEIFRRIA